MNKFLCLLLFLGLSACGDAVLAQRGFGGGFRGGSGGGARERIAPEDLKFEMGVAGIPDLSTFAKLSYKGTDVGRDPYLANLQYVKFLIENPETDEAALYFMNTGNYRAHPPYMGMVGMNSRGAIRGAISFQPRMKDAAGGAGLYVFDFQPNDAFSFETIKYVRDTLVKGAPFLKGQLAYHPLRGGMARYEADKAKYEASDVAVHLDADLYEKIGFLPLNGGESFGRLRVMGNETRSSPRDIVICKTLPNQMPRVAGVISAERQTPLSHVNLRCVQDRVPNAFVANAMDQGAISSLVGKLVRYSVSSDGYSLREATKEEVDDHFSNSRPSEPLVPSRDLSVNEIKPLQEIRFENAGSFGAKASNLATMHTFGFPAGMIPEGYGVPFAFYDEFMKQNGFYAKVDAMLSNPEFQQDREVQQSMLKELRGQMKQGTMSQAMLDSLKKIQESFSPGTAIRCRSSTNNEDLAGFSGAGLYDSFTHNPDEGHLAKSIKQVYASLWNFRAFEERDFYRVDHKMTAMGVLLHPNYKNERANGVVVTDDVLYESQGNYYINTQVGEDLVTNPDAESSPEEILLGWWKEDGHQVVRRSTDAAENETLLGDKHLADLRDRLAKIHGKFRKLYGEGEDDQFAMEVEFKITKDGKLVIKQARPWVFAN
ncbi:MAG: PEP/pyruvate-binding domain-containing protein [Rubripirellula sp.]|nr:PEP/pyruvate-binding domain-containing protein [Rubripirellula sp.]